MLYPIELLGHMTGRMVAGSVVFVMHINLLAAAKYLLDSIPQPRQLATHNFENNLH